MRNSILLPLTLIAVACGQPTPAVDADTSSKANQLLETKEVVPGTLFATFDPKSGYEAMQSAAKTACGTEAICKVIIFAPGTVLPTQFPMTNREVELQIGNYTMNRNSGADELLVDCDVIVDSPKAMCAATE